MPPTKNLTESRAHCPLGAVQKNLSTSARSRMGAFGHAARVHSGRINARSSSGMAHIRIQELMDHEKAAAGKDHLEADRFTGFFHVPQ